MLGICINFVQLDIKRYNEQRPINVHKNRIAKQSLIWVIGRLIKIDNH